MITISLLTALLLAGSARAASLATLHRREHHQVRTIHRYERTYVFFENRPWLAFTPPGARALRVAGVWLAVARRELRQTRAEKRAHLRPVFAVPGWWLAQALCIHAHESRDWHQRGSFSGGLQFLDSTWRSVGGTGRAADHSQAEQLFRAFLVWRRDGGSWAEWGTRGACGL